MASKRIPAVLRKAVLAYCRYEKELRSPKTTSRRRMRLLDAKKATVRAAKEQLHYFDEREVYEDISRHTHLCKR
jgi:hypothetical protein